MSGPVAEVIAGNTVGVWYVGHDIAADGAPEELAELGEDYSCWLALGGTEIAREVTDKNDAGTAFLAYLTPTESAALTPGAVYTVGIELRNAAYTPPLVIETQRRIRVKAGVVA